MREQRRGECVEVGVGQSAGERVDAHADERPPAAPRARSRTRSRARLPSRSRRPHPRGRASTAVAPRPSALSILRRSLPGTKRMVRSGGRAIRRREYVRLSCRANLRRSRRAHDRRCLVGRGLQPRHGRGLVRDARLRAARAADPRGLLAHALAGRRDHGDRLRRRGDLVGALGTPDGSLRRAADARRSPSRRSPAAALLAATAPGRGSSSCSASARSASPTA